MFEALSSSGFSQWVATSKWAYPILLVIHGLGLAVVVGLTVMIGIRVLGFPRQIPLAAYIKTVPLGILGLLINVASGTALFAADAVTLSRNPSFLVKMVSIVIGLIVLRQFYAGPLKAADRWAQAGSRPYIPTAYDKGLAVLSILIWLVAVIVSGRLIAYLAPHL